MGRSVTQLHVPFPSSCLGSGKFVQVLVNIDVYPSSKTARRPPPDLVIFLRAFLLFQAITTSSLVSSYLLG